MYHYTKLIPLLYPLNLEQNEWFFNLYRNLILAIYIENPNRSFNIDELVSFVSRNFNLNIKNIPELEEVLSRLSKDSNELISQNNSYLINPSKLVELEDAYTKVLGIDDAHDNHIIFEYEENLKDIIEVSVTHENWNLFYQNLFLPLVAHFYFNLTEFGLKSDKEILENYKSYIKKFPKNQDEIHSRTLKFFRSISTDFFKKHLIANIFFESVEGDIKEYDSIYLLLENKDSLDFFIIRNINFVMEILSTMFSIEDRIKSATSSISSLLFEDSFQRNLYYTEMANKQNEIFRKSIRKESDILMKEIHSDWETMKLSFSIIQKEFSTVESKIEILKEGINKHSKLILEAGSGLSKSVKSKHEASIHILKNKNVEVLNKITEFSMFFFISVILISAGIYAFFNEYFIPAISFFGVSYLLQLFYRLLEILINKKLIDYHKAELKEEIKTET